MSRFRRRLMGLSALRQALKDDFVRVEYIENTSNAYIDTGVIPNSRYYDVEIKFLNSGNKTSTCLFGARNSYTALFYSFWPNADSHNEVRATNGSNGRWANYDQSIDTNNKVSIFKLNENTVSLTVDGVENTWNITNSNYGATKRLFLFNCNNNNSIQSSWNFIGRVYYFKIYYNGELVRDFIPMYQKSKHLYGLWDRVNEEFYVSPNGVKFTGGERVIADADDNLYYIKNYIKCNGTRNTFIDLSKFTNLDNVEFEVYSNTAHDNFIGSRSGTPVRNHFQIAKWDNTRIDISFGQQSPTYITSKNTGNKKFKIKLWERIIYLDNEKFYTCPNNTFTTNTVVSLGAVKGHTQPTSARFYWFKWWNKDKDLIYDMIPVQRVSDGVWGMFCKVHLGFYPSNGSAQFTGG